jgi:hypothetical protein
MTRRARPSPARSQTRSWKIAGGGLAALVAAASAVFFIRLLASPQPGQAFPFPCLGHETLNLHLHPWLRIVINGRPVRIPAGIGIPGALSDAQGIVSQGSCFEPLHTHDDSGVIHIEGPDPSRTYTLADFFAVWRATYPTVDFAGRRRPVEYTLTSILGYRADATHRVLLLVDGKPSSAGPSLVLNRLDYCRAGMATPPCWPTAAGDPFPPDIAARYGTGHTIVIDYH